MVLRTEVTITRQIEIPEAYIKLRSDNIVHVHYKKNTVLDVELQERMRKIYNDITGLQKLNFIFSSEDGFTLTKEARENALLMQKDSPVAYYAMIANNLADKIIANFYIKVIKPKDNHKVFNKIEDAVAWLHSL